MPSDLNFLQTGYDDGDAYLDLLAKCLTRSIFDDAAYPVAPQRGFVMKRLWPYVDELLRKQRLQLVRYGHKFDPFKREQGQDWPANAETMIGMRRLANLHNLLFTAVEDEMVPGEFVECGIWRGGASIYARALLNVLGQDTRRVIGCDSFRGLPEGGFYPQDQGDQHHTFTEFAVPRTEVEGNFRKYGLWDGVELREGWFRDTLPFLAADLGYENKVIAVLRCDGDMYEGTMDPLRYLYDYVPVGGYVIIDDYGAVRGSRQATDDFREERAIKSELVEVDWTAVYWQKEE